MELLNARGNEADTKKSMSFEAAANGDESLSPFPLSVFKLHLQMSITYVCVQMMKATALWFTSP